MSSDNAVANRPPPALPVQQLPFPDRPALLRDPKGMAAENARLSLALGLGFGKSLPTGGAVATADGAVGIADRGEAVAGSCGTLEDFAFGDGTVPEFAAVWGTGVGDDGISLLSMPLPLRSGPPTAPSSHPSMSIGKSNDVIAVASLLARARSLMADGRPQAQTPGPPVPVYRWPLQSSDSDFVTEESASARREVDLLTQKSAAALLASAGFDASSGDSLDVFSSVMAAHMLKLSQLLHRLREHDVDEPAASIFVKALREMGSVPTVLRAHTRSIGLSHKRLRMAVHRLKLDKERKSSRPAQGST